MIEYNSMTSSNCSAKVTLFISGTTASTSQTETLFAFSPGDCGENLLLTAICFVLPDFNIFNKSLSSSRLALPELPRTLPRLPGEVCGHGDGDCSPPKLGCCLDVLNGVLTAVGVILLGVEVRLELEHILGKSCRLSRLKSWIELGPLLLLPLDRLQSVLVLCVLYERDFFGFLSNLEPAGFESRSNDLLDCNSLSRLEMLLLLTCLTSPLLVLLSKILVDVSMEELLVSSTDRSEKSEEAGLWNRLTLLLREPECGLTTGLLVCCCKALKSLFAFPAGEANAVWPWKVSWAVWLRRWLMKNCTKELLKLSRAVSWQCLFWEDIEWNMLNIFWESKQSTLLYMYKWCPFVHTNWTADILQLIIKRKTLREARRDVVELQVHNYCAHSCS